MDPYLKINSWVMVFSCMLIATVAPEPLPSLEEQQLPYKENCYYCCVVPPKQQEVPSSEEQPLVRYPPLPQQQQHESYDPEQQKEVDYSTIDQLCMSRLQQRLDYTPQQLNPPRLDYRDLPVPISNEKYFYQYPDYRERSNEQPRESPIRSTPSQNGHLKTLPSNTVEVPYDRDDSLLSYRDNQSITPYFSKGVRQSQSRYGRKYRKSYQNLPSSSTNKKYTEPSQHRDDPRRQLLNEANKKYDHHFGLRRSSHDRATDQFALPNWTTDQVLEDQNSLVLSNQNSRDALARQLQRELNYGPQEPLYRLQRNPQQHDSKQEYNPFQSESLEAKLHRLWENNHEQKTPDHFNRRPYPYPYIAPPYPELKPMITSPSSPITAALHTPALHTPAPSIDRLMASERTLTPSPFYGIPLNFPITSPTSTPNFPYSPSVSIQTPPYYNSPWFQPPFCNPLPSYNNSPLITIPPGNPTQSILNSKGDVGKSNFGPKVLLSCFSLLDPFELRCEDLKNNGNNTTIPQSTVQEKPESKAKN